MLIEAYEFEKCPCCGGEFIGTADLYIKECSNESLCRTKFKSINGYETLERTFIFYGINNQFMIVFVTWIFWEKFTKIVIAGSADGFVSSSLQLDCLLPFDITLEQIKLYMVFS